MSKVKLLKLRIVNDEQEPTDWEFIEVIGVGPPLGSVVGLGKKFKGISVIKSIVISRSSHEGNLAG